MSCTLVLLPGMDGTGELFSPLLKELGPDIQTVVVRYPDLPLDYAAHEAFARARLPSTGPFVVLGESFSGSIAISLAASPPDGMCGYVLCASFVRSPRRILNALRPLIRFVNFSRVHPALAQYFLMGGRGSAAFVQMHQATIRNLSNASLAARLHAISKVDVGTRLEKVRLPGLYIRATGDRLVTKAAAAAFAKTAPNARIADIEGPHFLLQMNPIDAARVLRAFIQEASAGHTARRNASS
jgi:pimeloyl-[acyl-carrier protein] methyl ester esterase